MYSLCGCLLGDAFLDRCLLNGCIPFVAILLVAVFPIKRSDNEAQLQTIAEEAFGAATERSVKEKRRSSEAKRKAFFFLAFRPSVVASSRVCVFLCFVSLGTKK